MLKNWFITTIICIATGLLAGCETNNVPLMPIRTVEVDAPADTQPATLPAAATQAAASQAASAPAAIASTAPATTEQATAQAAATAPATAKITKIIDPNQTSRFVYDASYNQIWQQAMILLVYMGFRADRQDYRLGVLTTLPHHCPQVVEVWQRDNTDFIHALESTVNSQRHIIRLTISAVPGKPKFYEIAVQAIVERQTNPTEGLGAPVFATGSGFGRAAVSLRSDYLNSVPVGAEWIVKGRDPAMEKKIINELFKHI